MNRLVAAALGLALLVGCAARAGGGVARAKGQGASRPVKYHGPISLGPISIVEGRYGAVSMRKIWLAIGKPSMPTTDTVCYRDPSAGTYLWITRGADDSSLARSASMALFPNCAGHPVYVATGFARWKTDAGIGLGSPESRVISVYGKPDEVETPLSNPGAFLDAFSGDLRAATKIMNGLSPKWRVLRYSPGEGSLSVSEFGVIAGKVQWIWISDNE